MTKEAKIATIEKLYAILLKNNLFLKEFYIPDYIYATMRNMIFINFDESVRMAAIALEIKEELLLWFLFENDGGNARKCLRLYDNDYPIFGAGALIDFAGLK